MVRGAGIVLTSLFVACSGKSTDDGSGSGGSGDADMGGTATGGTEIGGTATGGASSGAGGANVGGANPSAGVSGTIAGSGGDVVAGSGGVPAGSGGMPGGSGGMPAGSGGMPGGSGGSLVAFPPACVADLTNECPTLGACRRETDTQGRVVRECFDFGVSVTYEYQMQGMYCGPGDVTTREVNRGDGALCYTSTMTRGPGCESSSGTVTDGAGREIATVSNPYASPPRVYCTGGESASCSSGSLSCMLFLPDSSCEPGTCP